MERKTPDVTVLKNQIKRKRNRFAKELNPQIKGDSGQYQFQSGDITSEFDAALMGRLGSKAFSEMSKSDGVVGGILSSYKNLILSCNWTLDEITDATDEELRVLDIIYDWFFVKNNFEPTLNSILKMLEIGFSCFNKYYTSYKKENDFFMMPVLLERLQQSIYRIDYEKEIVEQITTKSLIETIPFSDLVFFTFRKEGNDLRGVSLLRQAYYDYVDKKDIKKIAKKGITRELLGLPIGKVPANIRVDSQEYSDFAVLIETMSNRNYTEIDDSIILPEGFNLELFKSDFKITEIRDYLSYFDSSIAISVLAQFILLGQTGKGGAYSLGQDQSNFFMDGLQYIVDYIEDQFTKTIISPTVQINWANVDATKFKLKGLNLNKKASKEFADIINILINSGVIKTQTADEKKIREMYGLPEIDESEREEAENIQPPPPTNPNPSDEEVEVPEVPEMPEEENEDENMQLNPDQLLQKLEKKIGQEIVSFWNTPKQRNQFIDQQTASLTKYSKASLELIADKLIGSIKWQLDQGNIPAQGLKDVKLNQNAVNSYKKNMGIRLASIAKKAWDNAKKKSRPHLIKIAKASNQDFATNPNQLPSKTLTSFVVNQSYLAVDKQVTSMKDIALIVANTATTKGYTNDMTLALVESSMDDFIASGQNAELTNANSIAQACSLGEMDYYKTIEQNLWGYRFENAAPITDLCSSMVGKTYQTGSAEMLMMSPPLHYRCKSYWEPIYVDNEKPEFDNYIPPASILKQKTM